jgi:hypothetical protein
MGVWNREGIGLSYRPARLHRPSESIPGLLKNVKIPSLIAVRSGNYLYRVLKLMKPLIYGDAN